MKDEGGREGARPGGEWDKEMIQAKSEQTAAADLICCVKYQQMFYYVAADS